MIKAMVSPARNAALSVLEQVSEEGAYANLALQKALNTGMSQADRALTTELVYGTIKQRLLLDWHLQSFLTKPMESMPLPVQHILRMGAYQLLFLDRVPDRAAINEAVNQVKGRGIAGLGGVVNAVLRNLARDKHNLRLPDQDVQPDLYLSVAYSHPLWMVQRWLKRWGFDATARLCECNNTPAPLTLRTNTLRIERDALLQLLAAQDLAVEPGIRAPESIHVHRFTSMEALQPLQQGLCTVQDESSMLAAHVLGPQPGEEVIDACAAPGGKTTHMAQLMQNKGQITAFEIHPHKLDLIRHACRRMGVECVQVRQGDSTQLSELVAHQVDRVLVDAPCSGLGVLRRKPDARWNKDAESIKELQALQLQIMGQAAQVVKPGGVLVYSTCTIEPEENFEVVKTFLKNHPEFVPADLNQHLPWALESATDVHMATKGYIQFLPHVHNMDGFFIARLEKTV
ncbi:MAG: 16S rRNA (cytosine(967)-C(5))-methyltransferase RsmB [Peptococcaceae bacterium]|nr:16S rRNA (cytosine(967)-C(5))-methyltransferase RsmB [Peptococcaceae bacterium]